MTLLDHLNRHGRYGCWEWTGTKTADGYGKMTVPGGRQTGPHRRAYELAIGPIPVGYQVDHLCNNPACCNPAHLEAVTPAVNQSRRRRPPRLDPATRCKNGHLFDEANTYLGIPGRRHCRACNREAVRRYQAKGMTA